MSRIVDAPITVTLGPGAGGMKPASFMYRGERHLVAEILDTWLMHRSPWWDDPKAVGQAPAQVTCWRIRTTKNGVFELIQDGTAWRLYRIWD